jgi:hypothetical protein
MILRANFYPKTSWVQRMATQASKKQTAPQQVVAVPTTLETTFRKYVETDVYSDDNEVFKGMIETAIKTEQAKAVEAEATELSTLRKTIPTMKTWIAQGKDSCTELASAQKAKRDAIAETLLATKISQTKKEFMKSGHIVVETSKGKEVFSIPKAQLQLLFADDYIAVAKDFQAKVQLDLGIVPSKVATLHKGE